jgi:hypothetical protein
MVEKSADILNPSFKDVAVFRAAALKTKAQSLGYETSATDAIVLASILITIQVLDGILTNLGISAHGISAEGNPFLRSMMSQIGVGAALISAKGFAIVMSVYLVSLTSKIHWLRFALKATTVLYLGMAIIPWTIILFKLY